MILLAFGLPGTGKTQALLDYTSTHANEHRFFVVDRGGDWGPESPRWRGDPPAITEMAHGRVDYDAYEAPGVYLHRWPWVGDEVADLARAVGNAVYVDDEIDLVATNKAWTEGSALRDFVHMGRHLPNRDGEICQIHILGAARRPQNLHTDLVSMADEILVFRVAGHRTLKRLEDDMGLDEATLEEARLQPDFRYLLWQNRTMQVQRGRIPDPFKRRT